MVLLTPEISDMLLNQPPPQLILVHFSRAFKVLFLPPHRMALGRLNQ